MIVGRLIKPCKICLYEQKEDGGEIESFSLLKLNLFEVCCLLEETKEKEVETTLDGSIVIKYSNNDSIHQKWKRIAIDHSRMNPSNSFDISKKFESKVKGTSCLIRDPDKHIIRIARRNGNDTNTINRMCIDDYNREVFFSVVKCCKYYKETGKYAMTPENLDIYTVWSKFMNDSFIRELKESEKNSGLRGMLYNSKGDKEKYVFQKQTN